MKTDNNEVISQRIRELIENGKGKGALTLKEITEQFSDCEIEPAPTLTMTAATIPADA